jgi:glucarate dehydratase
MDPNGVWSIGTAVAVSRKLRDYDLEYLEDPTWSLRGLSRVAAQAPWQVLASNQAVFSFEDLASNQVFEAIDVVLADPHWYGGLHAMKALGRIAEAYGFDLGMHSGVEFGVSQAVQLHACAAVPNLAVSYAADTHYPHLADDVLEGGKLPISGGCFEVPTGPGLGVRLDPDRLGRYHECYLRDGFQGWTVDPRDPGRAPVIPKW